jgi:hypothetical protein
MLLIIDKGFQKIRSRLLLVSSLFLTILLLVVGFNWFAEESSAQAPDYTVCPSGVAGQNGCDYIEGKGIQDAVRDANSGESILIKAGNYTSEDPMGWEYSTYKRNCFLNLSGKNLDITGETGTVIDGSSDLSAVMQGICSGSGSSSISNVILKGFKKDMDTCPDTDWCSWGRGIQLISNANLSLDNVEIINNEDHGIISFDSAIVNIVNSEVSGNDGDGIQVQQNNQLTIEASEISRNVGIGILLFDDATATVTNSNISNNAASGVDLQQRSQIDITNSLLNGNQDMGIFAWYSSRVRAKNVIVINNQIDETKLAGNCTGVCRHSGVYVQNSAVIDIDHSLLFGNEHGNFGRADSGYCPGCAINQGAGMLQADPLLDANYRPLIGSPVIDAGDPLILDPDGSRSDMGMYGGPDACLVDNTLAGCSGAPTPTPTPTATPTPTPTPTPTEIPTPISDPKLLLAKYKTNDSNGDLYGDGVVNNMDYAKLIISISVPTPTPTQAICDVDEDCVNPFICLNKVCVEPPASISGVVYKATGPSRWPNVNLDLYRVGDGTLIPAGDYKIEAHITIGADDWCAEIIENLDPGEDAIRAIVIIDCGPVGGSISGVVYKNFSRKDGVSLDLYQDGSGTLVDSTVSFLHPTLGRGGYEFNGLISGDYRIDAHFIEGSTDYCGGATISSLGVGEDYVQAISVIDCGPVGGN